jgi:hypothetical protein
MVLAPTASNISLQKVRSCKEIDEANFEEDEDLEQA